MTNDQNPGMVKDCLPIPSSTVDLSVYGFGGCGFVVGTTRGGGLGGAGIMMNNNHNFCEDDAPPRVARRSARNDHNGS